MVMNKIIWIILLAAGVAGLAIIWLLLPELGGFPIDDGFRGYMEGWAGDSATALMKGLNVIGSTAGIVALTLLIAAGTAWRLGIRHAFYLILAMAGGYALNTAIKGSVDRARPSEAWGIAVDGASFPSGNAMVGMILFGLTAAFVIGRSAMAGWSKGIVATACFVMIALLGLGRLYFHVHYLSDILAGYCSGLIVLAAAMLLPAGDAGRAGRKGMRRLW
jgi:undecaprenyl-diphosphatase